MTHSTAARDGPSEAGWAVFVAGQDIRCPAPGRELPVCRQNLGEVLPGTVVRIRLARPPAERGSGFTRICKHCKALLEQQEITKDREAAA
jgi:hypothetical protein